jgi:hypothetical protein
MAARGRCALRELLAQFMRPAARTRSCRSRRRRSPAASRSGASCRRRGSRRCSSRCCVAAGAAGGAEVIEGRLGRPLEPLDLWYAGFKARRAAGGGARRVARASAIRRPRRSRRHAADPRRASGSRRAGDVAGGAHPGRPVARGGARVAGAAARGLPAAAHARRRGGDGLQGLQHRGARARAQRRAGVLAREGRPHAADGGAEQRVHGGAGVRVPGAGPRAAGLKQSRTRRASASGC